MNKYSQIGQDDWVLSIIKDAGYYVDMGAYDGVLYSNTLKLEENGWKGLCIEANPNNFQKLMQNRKSINVRKAIANHVGVLKMDDEGSSSQRNEHGRFLIPCNTIKNIFAQNNVPRYIDYISSDIERMDAEIWEHFPFDEYSFGLATVEHCLYEGNNNFKERIKNVMLKNGYEIAVENVAHDGNQFEDWYINPTLKQQLGGSVTCYLSGRWGNIVFALAHMIAYAKKYDLDYYIPQEADAYKGFTGGNEVPFVIASTGEKPVNPTIYKEPCMAQGVPRYHEIPKIYNVSFDGYWQSFKWFDWCRDYILEVFGFPYQLDKGVTSISVRRGDCVGVPAFPIAPLDYYKNAVRYMQERGFNKFKVHSDDMQWCKEHFTRDNFGDAEIEFYEGYSERENYLSLCNCENNITARSTFSLTAAWFNRNPNKIVCVPTLRHKWWNTLNADLLTDTGFIQIDFDDPENTLR